MRSVSKQDKYPYYDHKSEVWSLYVKVIVASLIGIALILWGSSYIRSSEQFWNVFILGSITWLILIAAWVQISVNKKQWQAVQEGQKQTRELFDLVERPIIVVESADGGSFAQTQEVLPTIMLTNKGRMGAKGVLVIFEAFVGNFETYPKHLGTGIDVPFIANGDSISITNPSILPTRTLHLDEKVRDSVIRGDETLLIYGTGRYYDMGRRIRYNINPFVFRYYPEHQKFFSDLSLLYQWQITANLLEDAPWRPKSREHDENPN